MKNTLLWLLAIGLVLTAATIWQRHRLLLLTIGDGHAPALLAPADEGAEVTWHDDYFTLQTLAPGTFAIGEPRYNQQVYSYLILGAQRGVLFDAGPGHRDIRPVIERLTDLPITLLPSHFHYDHISSNRSFDSVAVVDLPYLRERSVNGQLALTWQEHLGESEGFTAPTLTVAEWLQPGSDMDLGGRRLRVLHTPGHTAESISLLDAQANLVFTGDFIYPGPLFAFLPNSSMAGYLQGAMTLLSATQDGVILYGAHRTKPPAAPRLARGDLQALQATLVDIRDGGATAQGIYPRVYAVNDQLQLLAEPEFLQDW